MNDTRQLLESGHPSTDLQRPINSASAIAYPLAPSSGSYGVESGGDENETHLLDYWRAVRKRLPLVIGIAVVVMMLATIYNVRRPNIYQAKTQVQVDSENARSPFGGAGKNGSVVVTTNSVNDPVYFNTQLQKLTSPDLLRRVVKNLGLDHDPKFLDASDKKSGSGLDGLLKTISGGGRDENKSKPQAVESATLQNDGTSSQSENMEEMRRLDPYVRLLQAGLTVEPVKDLRQTFKETRLIDISFMHPDPELAAKIVNNIADTFAQMNLEQLTATNKNQKEFLQPRIAELQQAIKQREEQRLDFLKRNGFVGIDQKLDVDGSRLVALSSQLVEAENKRKNAEAELNAVKSRQDAPAAIVEGGAAGEQMAAIRQQINALKAKRAELLVDETPDNPDVIQINKQIEELEKSLNAAAGRQKNVIVTNLETKYLQAKQTEDKLRADFNAQRGKVSAQSEQVVQYNLLTSEIEQDKKQLAELQGGLNDTIMIGEGLKNNIYVVERALTPDYPIGPQRTRSVAIAGALALAFGIGLALFLEYLDNTVRSVDDVEKTLRLPLLAVIPTAGELSKRLPSNNGNATQALAIGADTRSPVAEAYRQLRTSVMLSTAGRAPRTLLVTSSVPAEGKTTMAVNIAKSMAQTGARVLIIDADMRRPRQHSIFGLTNKEGLSTYLSSDKSEEELMAMIRQYESSSLYVLTSGPVPPNPAELLGSDQMRRLLSIVENSFTHVIIDSPPVASFTDGVLLASMVDGVLLIVHGGKTARDTVRRSRQLLQDVGARIFGVVLNNVSLRSHDYYYQSYYRSYYSPAESEEEQRA